MKEQKAKNIVDQRDPNEYIEVLSEQFDDPTTKALVAAMAISSGIAAQTATTMSAYNTNASSSSRSGKSGNSTSAAEAARRRTTPRPKPLHVCHYTGCGKVFRRPANLKDHERIHLGVKPYQCAYGNCQFASGRKENVIQVCTIII